ncbi:MAG: repeat protein [Pedosphaera sp.]|nr:repeat protein [Pedosphaera sp.]
MDFRWQIASGGAILNQVRTRKGIAIFLLAAIIVATSAAIFLFAPRQPVYQGKPLAYWLQGYDNPQYKYGEDWHNADEAMHHSGTNAIPTLLRLLRMQDSRLELRLLKFAQRQHFVPISHIPAAARNSEAARGFQALGPQASNAVPALVKIFTETDSKPSRDAAAAALGWLGPAASSAVPALLRGATNPDEAVRFAAVSALNQIHARAELVVPALIQALRSPDAGIRTDAAFLLGSYGAEARPAIPLLLQLSKGADVSMRFYAAYALKQIQPPDPAKTLAKDGGMRR